MPDGAGVTVRVNSNSSPVVPMGEAVHSSPTVPNTSGSILTRARGLCTIDSGSVSSGYRSAAKLARQRRSLISNSGAPWRHGRRRALSGAGKHIKFPRPIALIHQIERLVQKALTLPSKRSFSILGGPRRKDWPPVSLLVGSFAPAKGCENSAPPLLLTVKKQPADDTDRFGAPRYPKKRRGWYQATNGSSRGSALQMAAEIVERVLEGGRLAGVPE